MSLRLPKAVMPLEKVRFVHSWPTYNLGVRRAIESVEFDKATGMLYDKSDPAKAGLWLVKGEGLLSPADFWQGDRTMPAWDKTADWGAYHGAVDIAPEPKGDKARVYSAFPGKVVKTHIEPGYPESCVIVLTKIPTPVGNVEFIAIYQHLGADIIVRKGDTVEPGMPIGYLGGWGIFKLWGNEHLHVEIISKKQLPGIGDSFCVPCPTYNGTANSQFTDDFFKEWMSLPYVMSNLIPALAGWNKYASSA